MSPPSTPPAPPPTEGGSAARADDEGAYEVALRLLAERHEAARRLERLEVAAALHAQDRARLAERLDALRRRRVVRLAEALGAWRRGELGLVGAARRVLAVLRGRDRVEPTRLRLEDPIPADPFDAPMQAYEQGRLREAEVWLDALAPTHADLPAHARLRAMVADASGSSGGRATTDRR